MKQRGDMENNGKESTISPKLARRDYDFCMSLHWSQRATFTLVVLLAFSELFDHVYVWI